MGCVVWGCGEQVVAMGRGRPCGGVACAGASGALIMCAVAYRRHLGGKGRRWMWTLTVEPGGASLDQDVFHHVHVIVTWSSF